MPEAARPDVWHAHASPEPAHAPPTAPQAPQAELEASGDGDELERNPLDDSMAASSACENLPNPLSGDVPSGGQQVVAKLLISNAAAGSVIGKVMSVCFLPAMLVVCAGLGPPACAHSSQQQQPHPQ